MSSGSCRHSKSSKRWSEILRRQQRGVQRRGHQRHDGLGQWSGQEGAQAAVVEL